MYVHADGQYACNYMFMYMYANKYMKVDLQNYWHYKCGCHMIDKWLLCTLYDVFIALNDT